MMHTRRERLVAHVHGRVQGVGYRIFVSGSAHELGVLGSVQNRRDGSVRVEAEGPGDVLHQFLAMLRKGPPGARVTRVTEEWTSPRGFTEFTILPT